MLERTPPIYAPPQTPASPSTVNATGAIPFMAPQRPTPRPPATAQQRTLAMRQRSAMSVTPAPGSPASTGVILPGSAPGPASAPAPMPGPASVGGVPGAGVPGATGVPGAAGVPAPPILPQSPGTDYTARMTGVPIPGVNGPASVPGVPPVRPPVPGAPPILPGQAGMDPAQLQRLAMGGK